jgi:uncharacterized protein (DUF2062 family)/2-polyprenyl-3-methyl-5-hydroxy-6-metoxy-1,4-benzoquinol methylase
MPASLRELRDRLLREHTGPSRLGAAVTVGVVVGCSPFFGLHLWIGLGLALLLRINKLAVFLGSQISIPPLAPLLGFASVQIGSQVLEGRWMHLGLSEFTLSHHGTLLREFLLFWLVGGLFLGAALGLPAFVVTTLVVKRRHARGSAAGDRSASDHAWLSDQRRVLSRYAAAPRGHRGYLRFKLRLDPVYRQICEALGHRERVIDLGTGLALLPLLLGLREQAPAIVGVEWDERKLASARQACAGVAGIELVQADVRAWPTPSADAVLLIDLLHYYAVDAQHDLLRRGADALRPGGQLIIRETERRGRSLFTRAMEFLAVRLAWNRGPGLTYRTVEELKIELEALGLACVAEPSSSRLHRGNFLLWAERPGNV